MSLPHALRPLSRRLALGCLLLVSTFAATACGEDDAPATPPAPIACESKSSCYERLDGLSEQERSICTKQGSELKAACDASKATRKCTMAMENPSGGADLMYVYYFRADDLTGCGGTEEKLN